MPTDRSCVELFRFVSGTAWYCGFNDAHESARGRVYTGGPTESRPDRRSGSCRPMALCSGRQEPALLYSRRCGAGLTGTDAEPLRHQVWELPGSNQSFPNINGIGSPARVVEPSPVLFAEDESSCRCATQPINGLPCWPPGQPRPEYVRDSLASSCFNCFRTGRNE